MTLPRPTTLLPQPVIPNRAIPSAVLRDYELEHPETNSDAMETAIALAHHQINRLARRRRPHAEDVKTAFSDLDPSLTPLVVLELAVILECAGDHEPDWWDDIHLAGTFKQLTDRWLMSPCDAQYAVAWLDCLTYQGIRGVLPGPAAIVAEATVDEAWVLLVLAVEVIRQVRQKRTWYTRHRRCRRCWPVENAQ